MVELGPVSGVHGNLTSHDEAILVQLSNVLACRKFIIKFCDWKSEHTKSTTGYAEGPVEVRELVGKQFEWTYGSWQV